MLKKSSYVITLLSARLDRQEGRSLPFVEVKHFWKIYFDIENISVTSPKINMNH